MPRFIQFNGQTRYHPGGISQVRADALTPIGSTATGIVAILGEADSGPSGTVVTIDDPALGLQTFGSGPLADAIKIAFDPSADSRIPGGAFRVLAYKTNPGTPAYSTGRTAYALATSSVNTGSTVSVIKWTAGGLPTSAPATATTAATGISGFWLRQNLTGGSYEIRRIVSVSGGTDITVDTPFSIATPTNVLYILRNNIDLVSSPPGTGIAENQKNFSFDGSKFTVTKGNTTETATIPVDSNGKAYPKFSIMYTGGAVSRSGNAYGTMTSATATTTTIPVTLQADPTAATLNGKVLDIPSLGLRREILSHTAGAAAVTITLKAAHALTAAQVALLNANYSSTTVYVRDIDNPAGTNRVVASVYGKAGQATTLVTYLSSALAEDLKYAFTTNQALDNFTSVINSSYAYKVTPLSGVAASSIYLKDSDFCSYDFISSAVVGALSKEVDIRFDAGVSDCGMFFSTAADYVNSINANSTMVDAVRSSTEPVLATGTQTTTTGSTTTAINILPATMTVNAYKGQWAVVGSDTVLITSNTAGVLNVFPALSAAPGTGVSVGIYPYGAGSANLTYPLTNVYLTGATRGISTSTSLTAGAASFQDGFNKLALVRSNQIVPLIDQDLTNEGNGSTALWSDVAYQLLSYVQNARQNGRNECGGYIGRRGTKTDLINALALLNDYDVQVTGQAIQTLNGTGVLTVLPYWSSAVAAAGMRSGAPEVGEPLTFKYVKTASLTQDSSWSPKSVTDVNDLLARGLLFIEQTDQGFRWVRDMTSWVKDDNIAFMEGSTRDAVRYVSYDFRKSLEDKFTGLKGTPTSISDIRNFAASKLNKYNESNIIVGSLDENGVLVPKGWRKLRVYFSSGVVTVRVEIYPVTGITFELVDIVLQSVNLAA